MRAPGIFRADGEKPKLEYSVHKDTPEELAEFHCYVERSERLRAMRPDLMQKHPDQWVALTESGAFLVASSIDELVAKTHAIGDRSCLIRRGRISAPSLAVW